MKKIILSLITVASFIASAYSQTCTNFGYSSTGIADDFSSTTELGTANGGLYFSATPGVDQFGIYCSQFTATQSRTANPGKLSIAMTNPYGCYVPIVYSFGKNANNKTNTIDLTGNKTFTIDFTNLAVDTSTVVLALAIQDSLGRIINTYASAFTTGGGDCNNAYLYGITSRLVALNGVAPGSSITLSGTFAGGYQADYTKTGTPASGTTGTNCYLKNDMDFSIVSQIMISVNNYKQYSADQYRPATIGMGATNIFTFDNLRVGNCPIVASANAAQANISSAKLYPNPTSDNAKIELELKSASTVKVTLSDVMGKEVMVISEGTTSSLTKEFSVANLNKGIYTVNYFINGASAKSELLMVK